jgi:hypothetical protein
MGLGILPQYYLSASLKQMRLRTYWEGEYKVNFIMALGVLCWLCCGKQ